MQVFAQVTAFVASVLVARQFGQEGKGLMTLLLYIPTVLYAFSHMGLAVAGQFLLSRREGSAREHLTSVLLFPMITAGLVVVVFFLSYSVWRPYLDNLPFAILLPALLILPFTIVQSHGAQMLIALNQVGKRNISVAVHSVVTLLLLSILVFLPGATVTSALWGYIAGFGFGALSAIYFCLKLSGGLSFPSTKLIRRALKYGFWIYLAALLRVLFARAGFFFLIGLKDIGDGGVFAACLSLTTPLINIPWAVQAVLLPRTSALSDEDANRSTPVYFRQVTIVMLVVGVVVALLSKPVLLLFGAEFVRGQGALIILLAGVVFAGHNTLLTTHLLGRGKSQIAAIAAAVSLVTAVALNLLLVRSLGLVGAAIATAGAQGMVTITSLFFFRKMSRGKISELFHFRRSDLLVFREILDWLKVNIGRLLNGR